MGEAEQRHRPFKPLVAWFGGIHAESCRAHKTDPRSKGSLFFSLQQQMTAILVALAPRLPDAGALIQAVQRVIFGAELATLGQDLTGVYAQVWSEICDILSDL